MKIISIGKFIRTIIITIGLVVLFTLLFNTKALSRAEISYMDYKISSNDTLWQIANLIKENNINYINSDIREIIYEIKQINKKETSSLVVNEVLVIPEI